MENEILCACCLHKIDFESLPVCDRCGFINQIFIGDFDTTDKDARKHRGELIEKLKDISVICYKYGWDENQQTYAQLDTEELRVADGPDCDGRVVWASYDFGQWFDETEKTVSVEISFRYSGKRYASTAKFMPMKSDSYWHVGVTVTDDLRLAVCFGTKAKYAKTSGVDFISLASKG